jgi:hypothetical protein
MSARDTLETVAVLGVAAGVVYAIYKFSQQIANNPVTQGLTSGIAKGITAVSNWVYGSPSVIPSGNVILPDGTKVPISQVQNMSWDSTNNVASFTYNGYGYIIMPNPSGGPAYDVNGDYHAQ